MLIMNEIKYKNFIPTEHNMYSSHSGLVPQGVNDDK